MRFLRLLRALKGFWPLSIVLWLIGLALCVLALPLITDEREIIFIAMALVTSVWLLSIVLRQYHRIRAERNLEQLVELEVHREASESEPGDYQVLSERLKHAMAMQRAARSVEGGRASLLELPWYLVIGMAASGKTSLLNRSSLSVTMAGGSSLSAVSGTQHCDWYFSREAVMVDTAGRYLIEDQPASEFADFLKTLRKQRHKPAINGLVLVVSLPELLEQSRQQVHALADKLVSRVAEYRSCLATNPPVYLFFSKSDLLPGFTSAFDNLDHQQRQHPWGLTFALDELRRQGVSSAFQKRFPGLVAALRERVDQRVVEEGINTDSDLLRFPDHFAELSGVLSDFLEQFDRHHNAGRAPILRGLYFTSALQSGPTLPPLLNEQTRQAFALQPSPTTGSGQSGEKSYFITNTFREVIFPDRNLGLYYSRHGERRSLPGFMIASSVLVGLAVIAAQSWSAYNNMQWLDRIRDSVGLPEAADGDVTADSMHFNAERRREVRDALARQLAPLERYRESGVPLRLELGLYQGDALREPLKQSWARLMKRDVLVPLQQQLATQLRELESFGVPTVSESGGGQESEGSVPPSDAAADTAENGAGMAERGAGAVGERGEAIGSRALERMQERSTSRPTLGSVPTSASELGSRVRSEARSRTTDSVRDAWYTARSGAETELEEELRDRTSELGSVMSGSDDDESALTLSGERGPSLSEEMLTRLDQDDVEQLIESYSSLRLYLIVTDPDAHQEQSDFVASALPRLWSTLVERRGLGTSRDSIMDNAALYVHYLQQGSAPALSRDDALVARSREQLNAFLIDSSLVDREYLRYQLEVETRYEPLTLSSIAPEMPDRLLYSGRAVPAFFTRRVWEEYLRPAIIETVSGDLRQEADWVLNDRNDEDRVQSRARFVSQLMDRYKRDYAIAWERFLDNTHVANFDTLDQASVRLGELSDLQASPLRRVLEAVSDNTDWDDPSARAGEGDGAAGESSDRGFWTRVMGVFGSAEEGGVAVDISTLPRINNSLLKRHFQPVNRMLTADEATGSDNSVLNQYLLNLRQLKVRIDNVRSAQDTGRSSKSLITATLSGEQTEINTLRNFVASRINTSGTPLSQAMAPLFSTPVEDTWQALYGPACQQIEAAWRSGIMMPWQQMIAGRYPVSDSVNEASVRDMAHFIDPGEGALARFREQEIGDLASGSDQCSALADSRMLESIDRAVELGQVIDSLADLRNGFEVQINPTPGLTDIILTIDGQQLHYRNTPQSWERLIWPGNGEVFGARLDIIARNGQRHTIFDYPDRWGFLRMIESASIAPIDSARQRLGWRTHLGTVSFDVRNFGGVRISDLLRIKSLRIPEIGAP